MLTRFFQQDVNRASVPREGDMYKVLHIHNCKFELRYGYYEAHERDNPEIDPMPIYPDFLNEPIFTQDGFPFVTKMQDSCEHYQGKSSCYSECADCKFFQYKEDLIGICTCPDNCMREGG